ERCTNETAGKAAVARTSRRAAEKAALVADAPGGPLSSGVSGVAGAGAGFCGVLPESSLGGGSDPATGSSLRHGCGDPVRRHLADTASARAEAQLWHMERRAV